MNLKKIKKITQETLIGWSQDNASSFAAALAYYTIFSLAPLLVLCVAVAGLAFGKEAVESQILNYIGQMFGSGSVHQIQTMMESATNEGNGIVAQISGLVLLLIGAGGVFSELQTGLNTVWKAKSKTKGRGWLSIIKTRFLSFAMVLAIGFILLVSLVLTTVLSTVSDVLSYYLPLGAYIGLTSNFIISLFGITLLFALILKILPDVDLLWSDVWLGALFTSILFTVGKSILGMYLGSRHVGDGFGAASSLIVILIWVYYSSQILFLGAEFTKAYTQNKKN